MIKMLTAWTGEIDDIDDAWKDICQYIDLDGLKKNSAGLLFCHSDFVESGVAVEICRRLPFDVIGMTTMAGANLYGSSPYGLFLTILTSDDVDFETACTAPLDSKNYREKMTEAYGAARGKLSGDPVFIISFLPYLQDLSGAEIVKSFDSICGGIPIWGSIASGSDMSYEGCRIFGKKTVHEAALAMLLLRGEVTPEFINTSIPERNIRENRGEITDSEGCILRAVNGKAVQSYFEEMGLVIRGEDSTTTPMLVDYGDQSAPVALAIYHIDQEGGLLCGGEVPKGAMIAVGEIDDEGILETAGESIAKILASGRKEGILMLPCVTRYIMLAPSQGDEMKLVMEGLGKEIPWFLGYSGGEVCPVRDSGGNLHNRFHNFTFSACVF
ncbi:MAG: FIST C-terminal domain-containing protein [Synergistaceae bacterium]|jgi:hypothetical protein|nr:FIST C-terminal domain-containing protein [Synergistaceae bacterium]